MCNFLLDMNYLRKTKPGQAISHTSKVLHGLGLERFSQWNEAACSLCQVWSLQGYVTKPSASGLDICRNGDLFLRPSRLAQPRITFRYFFYLFKVFLPVIVGKLKYIGSSYLLKFFKFGHFCRHWKLSSPYYYVKYCSITHNWEAE